MSPRTRIGQPTERNGASQMALTLTIGAFPRGFTDEWHEICARISGFSYTAKENQYGTRPIQTEP